MASPEATNHEVIQDAGQALPDELIDPLSLAAQALSKLQAHGLPGVLQPSDLSENVLTQNDLEPLAVPAEIVSLDTYRRHRRPARDHHASGETEIFEDVAVIDEVVKRAGVPESPERPKRRPRLSHESQLRLIRRIQSADDKNAMERLCEDTYPLVIYFANKLSNGTLSFDFDEQVQAGFSVLPQAARRFDASQGYKWGTYASRRIIGAMLDEARQELPVPRSVHKRLKALAEIGDASERQRMLREWATAGTSPEQRFVLLEHMMDGDGEIHLQPRSLEGMLYNGNDPTARSYNPAEPVSSSNVEESVSAKFTQAELRSLVAQLPKNEQIVISEYYDLEHRPGISERGTLQEIGEYLGLTESRASQLHTQGLENLRLLMEGQGEMLHRKDKNRLAILETKLPGEASLAFLERIYDSIAAYEHEELSEEEVATIISALPADWQHQKVKLRGNQYHLLKLSVDRPAEPLDLAAYQTERRKAGWQDTTFTILAEGMTVSDLRVVIDMQKHLKSSSKFPVDQELASKLSYRELEVIAGLYSSYEGNALQLHIANSTVRSHVSNIYEKMELDKRNIGAFTAEAAFSGLIPLEDVPEGRAAALSPRGVELMASHYDETYEQTAEAMNLAVSTIRTHWHSVYIQMGAANRAQAVLMAIKDGLITERPSAKNKASSTTP